MKTNRLPAILLLASILVLPSTVRAAEPSVSTDKTAYGPEEPVYITGSGFCPGALQVNVVGPNGSWDIPAVTADETGWFGCTFTELKVQGVYTVTVVDTMNNTASTEFTDDPPCQMTVSYAIAGGGSGYSSPTFSYVNPGGVDKSVVLTPIPVAINVQALSSWSVSPQELAGSTSSERWYSNEVLSSAAGGNGSSETHVFTFHHQFGVTFDYTVVGGGSGYSAPSVSFTQFGASTSATAGASTEVWGDSGSSYSYPDALEGSGANERWYSTDSTRTGTILGAATVNPSYDHQYRLTISVNPSDGGTTGPVDDGALWYNSGTPVEVSATAAAGHAFVGWTLDGAQAGSGNPISVTMNAAHTLVANFQDPVESDFFWLPPINPDGSSIFKQKSTVPVKFRLSAGGQPVTDAVAGIYVYKTANGVPENGEVEVVSTAAATTGNLFRYDATDDLYIFNLATKNLEAGATYQIEVVIDGDGSEHTVSIGLK